MAFVRRYRIPVKKLIKLPSWQATLKAGEAISLVGFGTFDVKERAERKGRNPQTGQEITIAAAKIPSFKPGKALKDAQLTANDW